MKILAFLFLCGGVFGHANARAESPFERLLAQMGPHAAFFGSMKDCAATTIAGCAVAGTVSAGNSGSCAAGFTGTCSYKCFRGAWSAVSNLCIGDCQDQALSWSTNCGNTGSGGVLAHGASRSVSNTNSGFGGSVTVTCNNGTLVQSGPTCGPLVDQTFNTNYSGACPGGYCACNDASHNLSWSSVHGICQARGCQGGLSAVTSTSPSGWVHCGPFGGCYTNACAWCANRRCTSVTCYGCPP